MVDSIAAHFVNESSFRSTRTFAAHRVARRAPGTFRGGIPPFVWFVLLFIVLSCSAEAGVAAVEEGDACRFLPFGGGGLG